MQFKLVATWFMAVIAQRMGSEKQVRCLYQQHVEPRLSHARHASRLYAIIAWCIRIARLHNPI